MSHQQGFISQQTPHSSFKERLEINHFFIFNSLSHLTILVKLHYNPHWVLLDDPNQSHNVGVVKFLHDHCHRALLSLIGTSNIMYLLCNFLYNVKMKKGLPASLINFSLTSAVQSLHVFTATLTLSPVWITMPYLFIQLQPAHTAFTTVTINAHLMSEVSIFWFIVALWLSAALDFTFLMFITTCLRKKILIPSSHAKTFCSQFFFF